MAKDYYAILGVSKRATDEEIKRAYRKLAHEHHPDKGGDQVKFKELSEAYAVLSDKEKRARYDQFGVAGVNAGAGGFGGFDGFDVDLGGFGDVFETFFGAAFSQVQAQVPITLTQAVLGDRLRLDVGGETIELHIPSGTPDGASFRFQGKGRAHRSGRGDLIITVRVELPRRLSREQKDLFEKLKKTGL